MKRTSIIICLIVLKTTQLLSQQGDFPVFSGKYFGQAIPEIIPELFAKGVVSTENQVYANVTFNPDFTEVCWTPNTADSSVYHGGIFISKRVNGEWTEPEEIRFLSEDFGHRSPFYGLNGKRLYFQAYLLSNQGWDQQERFYFVERMLQGWSVPTLLDTILNKYSVHWQFSLDKENNLYFGGDLRSVENSGGIYFSKYLDGKYEEPILIFNNMKLDDAVFGPAISPDSDYILFARIHPRGSTNPRIFSIYISFLNEKNEWSEPMELGEKLNMDGNQPRISPDGKFIFFTGNDGMSYWVSAKIIDE